MYKKTVAALTFLLVGALSSAGSAAQQTTKQAIFAGGCFWCTESDFEKVKGVISAESGYVGGEKQNPTYSQVSAGRTTHTEAVRVVYDPNKVSYSDLLYVYWRSIDPTVENKQFCDTGSQYRTGIFYLDDDQQRAALNSLQELKRSGRFTTIYTEITRAGTFWPAEGYHQDYYKKNPIRYGIYRSRCGRDNRLELLWGDEAGAHPGSR